MSLIFRDLKIEDHKQFSKLNAVDIIFEKYVSFLHKVLNDNYLIIVAEEDKELVAIGTLIIDEKLAPPVSVCPGCYHLGVRIGRLEDIFVKSSCQRKGYGKKIVDHLVQIARRKKCLKIFLYCSSELENFYKKSGFEKELDSISMIINTGSACI